MIEDPQQGAGAAVAEEPGGGAVTAGALLRQAREAAGLHVAALAVSLKVPVRKLEALEDNRWDVLPDAVFVRALAASVCRSLKIDPQPILERLPQTSKPRLVHDGDGINSPFRAPGDGAAPTWFDQLTRPVSLAVIALLLGALVLVLLPAAQQEASVTAPAGAAETAAVPAPLIVPAAAAPAAPPAPAGASPTVGISAPIAASASASASTPASAAPGAGITAAATPASSAGNATLTAPAVPAASPASGIIVFRTQGPSWVEVTDSKGVVAIRKLLEPGETAGVSGALPLQVTVGRVDSTQVQVRGKPFDLRPVSRDNVARFEVK